MQDDTNTTQNSEQIEGAAADRTPATHVYYEISNDLLSKPTALCDIIEAEGSPSTVVFCNAPSDADLVEVMLKKRGVTAKKLIGHVPPAKVVDAVKQSQRGELSVLVVTDISARNIEVEDVDLIVNYSIPADPEGYIHRLGRSGRGGKRHTIISLVSPLDIGNFHYIKKFVETPFQKAELPTKDTMANIKFKNLAQVAERQALQNDPALLELVKQVLKADSKESLIAMLLHNTLNVIPTLRASTEREQHPGGGRQDDEGGEERQGRDRGDDRGGRGRDRNRRGRDRDDRGDRRDRGDRDHRGGRGRDRYQDDEFQGQPSGGDEGYQGQGDDQGGDYEERGERQGRGRRDRGERQPYVPPQRDVRIYIGSGSRHGLSEQKFRELVTQNCAGAEEKIKRFSARDCYSFVDIAEEAADEVVNKLDNTDVGGTPLLMKKAISINVPRENDKQDDLDGQPANNGSQDENGGQDEMAGENF